MKTRLASGAAALAILVALPAVLSSYQLSLLTKMLIFGIFAMSLDLLLGYAGLPSLGHAAYFGVAAYTVGLLALRVRMFLEQFRKIRMPAGRLVGNIG